jgi:hypothetical protein
MISVCVFGFAFFLSKSLASAKLVCTVSVLPPQKKRHHADELQIFFLRESGKSVLWQIHVTQCYYPAHLWIQHSKGGRNRNNQAFPLKSQF